MNSYVCLSLVGLLVGWLVDHLLFKNKEIKIKKDINKAKTDRMGKKRELRDDNSKL